MKIDFTDIEVELMRTVDSIAQNALKDTVKTINKEIVSKVVEPAIDKYYNEYEPNSYRRTRNLSNAFKSKVKLLDSKKASIDIRFNSDWMDRYKPGTTWIPNEHPRVVGLNNGNVERGWVLDNFFDGKHPIYKYDLKTHDVIDSSVYGTPAIESINENLDYYLETEMGAILDMNLKKQCDKYFGK